MMLAPLMIKCKHKEYGFEVMFISRNVALKTKAHELQRFGNEHYANKVGESHWYVPYTDALVWEIIK